MKPNSKQTIVWFITVLMCMGTNSWADCTLNPFDLEAETKAQISCHGYNQYRECCDSGYWSVFCYKTVRCPRAIAGAWCPWAEAYAYSYRNYWNLESETRVTKDYGTKHGKPSLYAYAKTRGHGLNTVGGNVATCPATLNIDTKLTTHPNDTNSVVINSFSLDVVDDVCGVSIPSYSGTLTLHPNGDLTKEGYFQGLTINVNQDANNFYVVDFQHSDDVNLPLFPVSDVNDVNYEGKFKITLENDVNSTGDGGTGVPGEYEASNQTLKLEFPKEFKVEWTIPAGVIPGDIDRDMRVNYADFAILADNWLECTDPNDPNNCTWMPQ